MKGIPTWEKIHSNSLYKSVKAQFAIKRMQSIGNRHFKAYLKRREIHTNNFPLPHFCQFDFFTFSSFSTTSLLPFCCKALSLCISLSLCSLNNNESLLLSFSDDVKKFLIKIATWLQRYKHFAHGMRFISLCYVNFSTWNIFKILESIMICRMFAMIMKTEAKELKFFLLFGWIQHDGFVVSW